MSTKIEMNTLLINQLANLNLFTEPMLNHMVSDYIHLYTVTIEFDLYNYSNDNCIHKSHSMSLDKFIMIYEKTPNFFKDYSFGYNRLVKKLSIKFYFDETFLTSTDHLSLVPHILKTLQYYNIQESLKEKIKIHPILNQRERNKIIEQELIEKIKTNVNETGQNVVKINNQWYRKLDGEYANTYVCLLGYDDHHLIFEKLTI